MRVTLLGTGCPNAHLHRYAREVPGALSASAARRASPPESSVARLPPSSPT